MNKYISSIFLCLIILVMGGNISFANGSKLEISRNLSIFNNLYKELHTNYVDTIDSKTTIETAINAMLYKLDPYNEYYDSDKAFKEFMTDEYAGIGSVHVLRDSCIYINSIVEGFPAHKAGLKVGDQIIAINDTLINKANNNNVSNKIRGQAGSNVKITVKRPYVTDSIISFNITREIIKPNILPYYGVINGNIGYIALTSFKDDSYKMVKNALIELKKNPDVKAIVLDLRNNGGGLIDSSIDILSLFLPKNTEILQTRGRGGVIRDKYKTTNKPIDTKIPLAVLINEYSASAAEVVAGSLQDLDRAVIIGKRSFGKGLVQSTVSCGNNTYLKVTTAKYYLPSGRLIQALDYSHRNADGSVARTPDSLTNVFHTANHREVRDGGGITPDITIKDHKYSEFSINASNKHLIEDYATFFAAHHSSIPAPQDFVITDSIYNDFKKFAHSRNFKYDKVSEKQFKALRKSVEDDGYMNDSIKNQFDILENLLKHDLETDLNKNRREISNLLSVAITERYYLNRGALINSFNFDPIIDETEKVLLDPTKYSSILNPQNSKK